MPVEEPIVATGVLPELQVPLPVASASVLVAPRHPIAVPVIAAGRAFTVTVVVCVQPPPLV